MNKRDVLSYFGGVAATAKALGISHVAVSKWGNTIPQGRAYQIEVLTGGELKADPATPSGQQRPYQRVAPGTPLADTPSVQRATDTAKDSPTKAQPGQA